MRIYLLTGIAIICSITSVAQVVKPLPATLITPGSSPVKTTYYIPGTEELLMISHQYAWFFSKEGKLLRGPVALRQDGGDAWYPRVSENGRFIAYYMPGPGMLADNDRIALFDADSNRVKGTFKLPMASDFTGFRFGGDSILVSYSNFMEFSATTVWRTLDGKIKQFSFAQDSIPSGMYDLTYYKGRVIGVTRYADSLLLINTGGGNDEFHKIILLDNIRSKCQVQVTKGNPYIIVGDEDRKELKIFASRDTSFEQVTHLPFFPLIYASAGGENGCYLVYQDTSAGANKIVLYNFTTNEEISIPYPELISPNHIFNIYPGKELFTASDPVDGTMRVYSLSTALPLWVVDPQIPVATDIALKAGQEKNSLFKVMIKQGTENVTASWFDQSANQVLLVKNNDKLVTVDAESKCAVKYEQFYYGNGKIEEVRLTNNKRYILFAEQKWQYDPDNADDPNWKKSFYQYPYTWSVFDRQKSKIVFELKSADPQGMVIINDSVIAWSPGGYTAGDGVMETYNLSSGKRSGFHPMPGKELTGLKTTTTESRAYFLARTYDGQLLIANDSGKTIFKGNVNAKDDALEYAAFVDNSPYVYFTNRVESSVDRLYKINVDRVTPVRAFPKNAFILAAKATSTGCYFLYRKPIDRKNGTIYHYRLIEMISGRDRLIDSSESDNGFTRYELYPDEDYYITIVDNVISWHDLNSGYMFKDFGREEPTIVSLTYSPDGRYLAAANPNGKVMLWDLGTGRETKTLAVGTGGYITRLAFSGDGRYLAASSGDIWETASGKNVVSVTDRSIWAVNSIDFSLDGQRIISGGACIISWDAADGSKLVYQQEPGPGDMDTTGTCWNPNGCVSADYGFMVHSTAFHPNSRDFVTGNKMGVIQKWNTETRKLSAYKVLEYVNGQPDRKVDDLRYTRDGNFVIAVQEKMIYRLDGNTLVVLDSLQLPEGEQVLAIDMGYDENLFGCITSRQKQRFVQLRKIKGLDVTMEFRTEGASFNKISFSPNKKHAATASDDGFCTIWDIATGEPAVYLSTMGDYGNIMVTSDNYYMASKSALEGVTFFRDGAFYSFDQFDLYLNRPDIVLERLGYANAELLNFYRNAYYKRLKKSGSNDSIPPTTVPALELKNRQKLPLVTKNNLVALELEAFDEISKKGTVKISVNGNLVSEISVNGDESGRGSVVDSVLLAQGVNNIEAVYRSFSGVESHKQKIAITSSPSKKVVPKTWFIGIGVSRYNNNSMNLRYPVKDIRDLVMALKKKFPGLVVDTLLDSRVTRENILALREKLLRTNVNDRVIISFNGHGLLSDSLDWYFGTHDIDPARPEVRGLAYAQMEGLLQGIPARKKLLLLDACHSGEVDREKDITFANRTTDMNEDVKATARGIIIKEKEGVGLQTSFELMQEIFANLNNGNGTTVLSAAGGTEYALESDTWRNGVFTYSVLRALKDPVTDENKNKRISVKELKRAVFESVRTLTGGRQKPTSRVEVLDDWEL